LGERLQLALVQLLAEDALGDDPPDAPGVAPEPSLEDGIKALRERRDARLRDGCRPRWRQQRGLAGAAHLSFTVNSLVPVSISSRAASTSWSVQPHRRCSATTIAARSTASAQGRTFHSSMARRTTSFGVMLVPK